MKIVVFYKVQLKAMYLCPHMLVNSEDQLGWWLWWWWVGVQATIKTDPNSATLYFSVKGKGWTGWTLINV